MLSALARLVHPSLAYLRPSDVKSGRIRGAGCAARSILDPKVGVRGEFQLLHGRHVQRASCCYFDLQTHWSRVVPWTHSPRLVVAPQPPGPRTADSVWKIFLTASWLRLHMAATSATE
jgi:hypothetical protein